MSDTFAQIRRLLKAGDVKISEHGYDELAADGLLAREVIEGVAHGEILEDYPDYPKGPCVLVLQRDTDGKPLHAVWGIPRNAKSPAVLVTAYRPAPERWTPDFRRRQ